MSIKVEKSQSHRYVCIHRHVYMCMSMQVHGHVCAWACCVHNHVCAGQVYGCVFVCVWGGVHVHRDICVCMGMCVHGYRYVCVHGCVCMSVYMGTSVYVAYVYTWACVHGHVHGYVCLHGSVCVCMWVDVYIGVCTCAHVSTCMSMSMYSGARLCCQQVPRIHLPPSPQHWDYKPTPPCSAHLHGFWGIKFQSCVSMFTCYAL